MAKQKPIRDSSPDKLYAIAEQRIADAKASHQTWLDLGDLGLDRIPDSLEELTKLEILSFMGDRIISSTVDDIEGTVHGVVSSFRSVVIICQLTNLESLNLRYCGALTALPECFGQLTGLKSLNLYYCSALTALPESFGQLTHLKTLDIGCCYALTALPESFGQLTGLKTLRLFGCGALTALPESLGQLTGLEGLDLSHCYALTALPKSFGQLTGLKTLNLMYCRWFTHDMLVNMANDFSRGQLPNLKTLDLTGTEVQLPRELIASQSAEAIFEHVLKSGKTRLRIAKVLLVGIGEAGKSHLLQRLYPEEDVNRNYFDPVLARTKGIDERTITLRDGRPEIRLWDFGGQMHLHSIHRFFLGADHCAYILVLDATKDATSNRLNYWLRFIAHHGTSERNETHSRTPVLIVLNKCDAVAVAEQYPKWSQSQAIIKNNDSLLASLAIAKEQQWYGTNVIGECIVGLGNFNKSAMHSDALYGSFDIEIPPAKHQAIGANHAESLDEIEARLQAAFDVMPGADVEYAAEFHRLRDYVDSQFTTDDVSELRADIESNSWKQVLNELAINSCPSWWLDTLHSLGSAHWIGGKKEAKTDHKSIRNIVFNPRWVRNWIYKLVELSTDHRHGELDDNHLEQRLKGCTTSVREKVLELAKACQVTFPMRDANGQSTTSVLVPDLLQDLNALDVWPSDNTIVDELRLPFLSDRILLRFVAEHWTCVPDKQKTYRNQVTVRVDNCDAMIQSIVEPTDGKEPFLRVCVNRTQTDHEHHRRNTKSSLVKLLKAEKLLPEDANADWKSPSDTKRIAEDELRERIAEAIKDREKWISAKEVGKKLDCDSKTVKRDKAVCEVIIGDVTYHQGNSGRIWKRVGYNDKYLYLESSVAAVKT